jgi:sugar phosphate permease
MQALERETSRVYRKVAWRIVPFLMICYTTALIDRFNIGFAKLQFLQDLGLDDTVFGVAAGAFSVGYVALEVPSNYLLSRTGLRKTLLRIMVLWGSVTLLLAFARGAQDLYGLRFLLGAAEGGFFPGILFYLTLWFPDRLRGRMTSLFVMAVPLAGVIAGPLSGWIMDGTQNALGLKGWQWLFLVEGLPAIVLGVVAYIYLPDSPAMASWLTASEREFLDHDLLTNRRGGEGAAPVRFRDALLSRKVYLLAAIYFAYFCSLNTILLWTPTILKRIGVVTATEIGQLSGLISVIATIGMLIAGYSSDSARERRWHVAISGLGASASFLLLPFGSDSVEITTILLTCAAIGIFSILGLFWTIPSAYLKGPAAAGGLALISSIGSFGGAVCPAFVGWVIVKTNSIYPALAAVAVLLALGMIALLTAVAPSKERSKLAPLPSENVV